MLAQTGFGQLWLARLALLVALLALVSRKSGGSAAPSRTALQAIVGGFISRRLPLRDTLRQAMAPTG
ncbi:MAG TPA: hypothetical protein VMV45_21570 [Casimicrobiaceae bacterium]|nr:hypothetical protein [Casimicrobiaceae bacterium]